jgi:hypothetical protein
MAVSTTDPGVLVIDDFTTGFDQSSLISGAGSRPLQAGDMLGNLREVYFSVDSDPLAQSSSFTINGQGGLIISSGLKSFWGIYLVYGYDLNYNLGSVDLDLSPYDTVVLDFGSNDQPVSGVVQFYAGGAHATANWYADVSSTPFSVDIPYTEFATTTGSPLPWTGVSQVVVLLQSGSANAGNDLELKSVALSDE